MGILTSKEEYNPSFKHSSEEYLNLRQKVKIINKNK
jgi:hypothetical protein